MNVFWFCEKVRCSEPLNGRVYVYGFNLYMTCFRQVRMSNRKPLILCSQQIKLRNDNITLTHDPRLALSLLFVYPAHPIYPSLVSYSVFELCHKEQNSHNDEKENQKNMISNKKIWQCVNKPSSKTKTIKKHNDKNLAL